MHIDSPTLLARKKIDLAGKGLTSINGAAYILETISGRRTVTSLTLGHNPLGDDGCEMLFDWLCSPQGRKYGVQSIHLNLCSVGDRGLLAIGRYLKGNAQLKELWLQSNCFVGEAGAVASFVEALNSSHLELLSLANNQPLLITRLLEQLDAPFLRELQCSMCALTLDCAPSLMALITSPRCRLHTFRANANSLGLRAIRDVVDGVERVNFGLLKLDLFMNGSTDDLPEDIQGRESVAQRLRDLLTRNALLKHTTESEALTLLQYSRLLLLRSRKSLADPGPRHLHITFPSLPTELQLHILSYFAPTLSSIQRIRIYTYASDPATLPQLLPTLSKPCLPDPSSLDFAGSSGCSSGHCMGAGKSISCNREEERKKWLALVDCDRYQPEGILYRADGEKRGPVG